MSLNEFELYYSFPPSLSRKIILLWHGSQVTRLQRLNKPFKNIVRNSDRFRLSVSRPLIAINGAESTQFLDDMAGILPYLRIPILAASGIVSVASGMLYWKQKYVSRVALLVKLMLCQRTYISTLSSSRSKHG